MRLARAAGAAVAVVVGQRGREGRGGDAQLGRPCHHAPPRVLGVLQRGREELGEHEVGQARLGVVGLADAIQEAGADDAAAAPDRRHRRRGRCSSPRCRRRPSSGRSPGRRRRSWRRRARARGRRRASRRQRAAAEAPPGCRRREARWSFSALNVRANTASVIPVSGTPSSSASCAVQRPVPFCSAASRMTSTSGLPVASSVLDRTRAEISIRKDSSSESFHLRKRSAIRGTSQPTPLRSRS